MKRYVKLWACSAVALAVIWVFVTLAFAQDKKPELTDPGIFHAGPGPTDMSYGATTLNTSPTEEIVHCDKTAASGRPTQCHFVGKHTLDDVIQYIWKDGENRREMYKEQAEALRKMIKEKAELARDAAACDGDDVAIPRSEHHSLPWYRGRDAKHDCVQRHPKVPALKPPKAKWIQEPVPEGMVTGDPQWIGHWGCPKGFKAIVHRDADSDHLSRAVCEKTKP